MIKRKGPKHERKYIWWFWKKLKEKNKDKYKYIELTLLDNGDIIIYGCKNIADRDILVYKTYSLC